MCREKQFSCFNSQVNSVNKEQIFWSTSFQAFSALDGSNLSSAYSAVPGSLAFHEKHRFRWNQRARRSRYRAVRRRKALFSVSQRGANTTRSSWRCGIVSIARAVDMSRVGTLAEARIQPQIFSDAS